MRPKLVTFAVGILVAGVCLSASPLRAAHEHGAAGAQSVDAETFLGFRASQEVGYILERADGEPLGVRAVWGMRLDEFDREVGVFGFTYEAAELDRSADSGEIQGGTLMSRTTGTAWINRHGFPTRVRFTTQRNTPMGGIEYTVEYRHENDRFVKKLDGGDKHQDVKIDDFVGIDREAPAGLYLFMPVGAECIAAARRMRDIQGSGGNSPAGGGTSSGAGGGGLSLSAKTALAKMDLPCRGREPAFANPGLLNLTMPALWETGTGSLELVVMAPTGIHASVLMNPANRGGGTGFSVGGMSLLGGSGPNPFNDADDAFERFSLTAEGDMLQLEVGSRSVDAWRLRASAPLESAYVDGNGSIARLDLPADPDTGERYWIRRLRPSEF